MRLKILHVYAGPYPTVQGTQALIGQTCRSSCRLGHQVHLLCYGERQFVDDEPFTIHRIADKPKLKTLRSGPNWQRPILDVALTLFCRKLIAQIQPDIIHAHHVEALAVCKGALAMQRTVTQKTVQKIPLVFHAHALLKNELGTYLSENQKSLSPLASLGGTCIDITAPHLANHIITVNEYIRRQYIAYGTTPNKVTTILPPMDFPIQDSKTMAEKESANSPEPNSKANDPNKIIGVYVGNLDKYQGIDTMLDSLNHLGPIVDSFQLHIITGSNTQALKKQINSNPVLKKTVVVGNHGSFEEAFNKIKQAHLAIIPRHLKGGIPIKLINAFAAQLPVLADSALVEQLTHGKHLWLVNMKEPQAIADGLKTLIQNETLRKQLGKAGFQKSVQLFNENEMQKRLTKVYNTTLFANKSI